MNADDKRKFLKDVLHTMRTSSVSREAVVRVGEVLGMDRDFVSLPGFVIMQHIERALTEDANMRAQLEHRRKDDGLAIAHPRAYNKGVLDALGVVQRLENAANTKGFSSDARLLDEVIDELTDLLRRPSREETTRHQCRGTGCGGACSTPKVGQVSPQEPHIHHQVKEPGALKHEPSNPPTERVGQTLHERLLDFGHHFDVQLLCYAGEEEKKAMMNMYPATQGWVVDPTCWQRKTVNGTINIRVVYRQVVQP